jgi:hypothetical protein
MANPPFPVVSVFHYKPFRKESCDKWDTLEEKITVQTPKSSRIRRNGLVNNTLK